MGVSVCRAPRGGQHKDKEGGLGSPFLARAFNYTKKYCQDICYDNMYITTYFRQIDARRKKQVRWGEKG